MPRRNPTKEYEVVVSVGPSGSMEDGTFGYQSVKSYFRFGRWDAEMKATEERKKHPTAKITIRAAD
jgi:hypothetical protein